MSILLDNIYSGLPASLQSVAISCIGWKFARQRYGREYHKHVNRLMRSQWFSKEQFRGIQEAELRNTIEQAVRHVPYYRKTLGKLSGIHKITLEILRDLPLVESSLIRTNIDEFINQERLKYGYLTGHTSGTSGSPFLLRYDLKSVRHNLAFRERQFRWAGLTGREKCAWFSGKLIMGKHNNPPFWRYNGAGKQWFFSIYHMNEDNLPIYFQALKDIDVVFLHGYPSAIHTLAKWINKHDKSCEWRPWAITSTAETLLDYQRTEIEKAFGCKVFDFYSSSEGAPFITQCSAGSRHMNPESGIVEFLRSDGTQAEPGEEGRMAVTSFFQKTMPLIRYCIGDVGALAEDQSCPCGRQMPVVKYIGGRQSDCLFSAERGYVGIISLGGILKRIPYRIKDSQIEQTSAKSFVYRYVPFGGELNEEEKSIIIEEFHKRLGVAIDVSIELVDMIPKGANGKSRLIIGMPRDAGAS